MEITEKLLNDVYHKEEINLMWISGTQGIENSGKKLETLSYESHYITDTKGFWGHRLPGAETTRYHKYELANEFIEGTPEYIAKRKLEKKRSEASKLAWARRNSPEAIQAREDLKRLAIHTKEEEEEYQKVRSYMMEEFLSDEEEIKKEALEIANQHIIEVMDELVFL